MSTNDHLGVLRAGGSDFVPPLVQPGEVAPDFHLPATGGAEIKLSEVVKTHRATIVAFYVLDFTPG